MRSLRPGKYQPRTRMDQASLAELAESIRARGILQPVVVRPVDDGGYEILAGERRWRAAQLAGLERIPALVREVADDVALGIGLIENIQREDLNPIEESAGLKRLIDEFKLTHDEAAKAVGRSRSAVTNLLRLLELAKAVQDMLQDGRIDMGHARALLGVGKAKQVELAEQVAAKGLSVRETERLVQHAAAAPKAGAQGCQAPRRRRHPPPPGRTFRVPGRERDREGAQGRARQPRHRLREPRAAGRDRRPAEAALTAHIALPQLLTP